MNEPTTQLNKHPVYIALVVFVVIIWCLMTLGGDRKPSAEFLGAFEQFKSHWMGVAGGPIEDMTISEDAGTLTIMVDNSWYDLRTFEQEQIAEYFRRAYSQLCTKFDMDVMVIVRIKDCMGKTVQRAY